MKTINQRHDKTDVLFEDGTLVKDKSISSFIQGYIAHPILSSNKSRGKDYYEGKTFEIKGEKAVILEYRSYHNVLLALESGELVDGYDLSSTKKLKDKYAGYFGFKVFLPYSFKLNDGRVYYRVVSPEGKEDIMTPQQIMKTARIKNAFLD